MVGLIFIYKRDLFNVKIEIYYQTIRIITKNKCNNRYLLNKSPDLNFANLPDIIALQSTVVDSILIMYINENV